MLTHPLSSCPADSEMHSVYLKSVRSPAVQGKFKMSYKSHQNIEIFSQVLAVFKLLILIVSVTFFFI